MEREEVFYAADGTELRGTLNDASLNRGAGVVIAHGLTVEREEDGVFTHLAAELARAGLPSFRFDFRGHGKSGGRSVDMTVAGEALDLSAAIDLAVKLGMGKVGVVAASFAGGAASLVVPSRREVGALVMWNAVVDFEPIFNPHNPDAREFWNGARETARKNGFVEAGPGGFRLGRALMEEMGTFRPADLLAGLKIPVQFIHGDIDALVPWSASSALSKRIPGSVMETLKGAGHGFHNERDKKESCRLAVEFLSGNLAR
jgi:pimeloyl-ACP methyl ester carboxylesterase